MSTTVHQTKSLSSMSQTQPKHTPTETVSAVHSNLGWLVSNTLSHDGMYRAHLNPPNAHGVTGCQVI